MRNEKGKNLKQIEKTLRLQFNLFFSEVAGERSGTNSDADHEEGEIPEIIEGVNDPDSQNYQTLEQQIRGNRKALLPEKMIMLPDSKQVLLKYNNEKLEKLALFILKNCSTSTDTAEPVRVYDKRMCQNSTWVGIVLRKAPDTGNIASDIMKSFNNSVPHSRDLVRNEDILTP